MAASVCTTSRMVRPLGEVSSRPRALTTPTVSVWSSPKGLPMASTRWPTTSPREAPRSSGRRLSRGASMRSTAMSLSGAEPTTSAGQSVWSESVTWKLLPWLMTW